MKKQLLAIGSMLTAFALQAQVVCYVLQPPSLEGPLEFTWAQNWGQTPDLNDPANTVEAYAAFVDDGTAADSLGCNPLVNGAEIAGRIAVVYRGTCQFGLKSLNAQNAGAVAVVIINNVPGAPIAMGGGDYGGEVTIPVVMITQAAGAALREEIINGNVVMRIGSVAGLFPYNLNLDKKGANISEYSALPKWLAQSASEFNISLGSWVYNYGSQDQSGVTLNARVTQNGTEVYNQTSSALDIPSLDSVFFELPAFSQNGYNGRYEVTYTVNSPNTDEFPSDNTFVFSVLVDSLYSFAPTDPTTKLPIPSGHYRATGGAANFQSCIYFQSPNASRVVVEGIWNSASKAANASMDGEVMEVKLMEWNDNFAGWSGATFNNIVTMSSADYFYNENLSGVMVYTPLPSAYALENNKKYLFCTLTPSADVFQGFNENLDYTNLQNTLDKPIYVITNDGTWGHFGSDITSAIGVRMRNNNVGIEENTQVDVTPYPNPTSDLIRIPLRGRSGAASLEIHDMAGNKVAERRLSIGGDQAAIVDMEGIANGVYLFNMTFEDGCFASFRVVVTK